MQDDDHTEASHYVRHTGGISAPETPHFHCSVCTLGLCLKDFSLTEHRYLCTAINSTI